jgi:hypothetical protein
MLRALRSCPSACKREADGNAESNCDECAGDRFSSEHTAPLANRSRD